MDYAEARPSIKSGDILAFSHVGWKTWHDWKIQFVRMVTRSEYSHLAVAWVIGGRVMVVEAVMPLIRIYPLSKLGDFYLIPMNLDWTPNVEEFALSKVGQEYSQLQAVESFFETPKSDDLWHCVEYARAILATAGVTVPGKYTPSGTVRALEEMGKVPIFVKNS